MDIDALIFKYLVYFPVVWVRGQNVPAYLNRLLKSQYQRPDELQTYQVQKLKEILFYAEKYVPFYRESLHRRNCSEVRRIEDIRELPCVAKGDLKRNSRQFVSEEPLHFLTRKTTGGSTGEPLTILKTRDAMALELAATWRGYSWAGVDIGDRQGRFWGVSAAKKDRARAELIDFIANRRRCSAFSFDEQNLENYTETLCKFKPVYFYGYVSMLEEYARFFARRGESPPFELKCVITTSEVLAEPQRKLIEQVFKTRVFNEYGSGELGSVAHECEHGSLHLSAENLIVEVLDGERACKPGEIGELVVTELNNRANPLIRYRTGDFAAWSDRQCKCGRTLPTIENLHGRAYDTIRNRDGKRFHGEFMMYIFEEAQRRELGVSAFQVIQETFQSFRIRIVAADRYGRETEKFLVDQIREGFDPQTQVSFELVDSIERAASGKMRLIVGMGE